MNMRTTVIGGADMIGDLLSPVGSRLWCVGAKFRIQKLLDQHETDHESIESLVGQVLDVSAWTQLAKSNGQPFASYTEFCTTSRPYGLGRSDQDIKRIIAEGKAKSAAELVRDTPPVREVGRPKAGESNVDNINIIQGGTSSSYLAARLNRDHPDIAARVEAGEFRSMRAAAIEAGIISVPTRIQLAQKAFVRMSREDQLQFAAWLTDQMFSNPRAC
jgi:hypothetical protein